EPQDAEVLRLRDDACDIESGVGRNRRVPAVRDVRAVRVIGEAAPAGDEIRMRAGGQRTDAAGAAREPRDARAVRFGERAPRTNDVRRVQTGAEQDDRTLSVLDRAEQ